MKSSDPLIQKIGKYVVIDVIGSGGMGIVYRARDAALNRTVAIKMLKRKLASEGVLRELKMRRHYMKPSVKRRKKQAEAARRRRKRAKVEAIAPKP